MLAACIKRKAFPGKKDEEICDDSVLESIAENEAQVNKAFKLPYMEKIIFRKRAIIRSCFIWQSTWKSSTHR